MFPLAKNEEINQWLAEHPAVLGGGAAVLGLILLGVGVSALLTGKATSKRGHELKGGTARLYGLVFVGFGAVCLVFAAIKMLSAVR